jgi:hypothetical protein
MIDGMWTLEYEGDAYFLGGGVLVIQGDKLYGGDSVYYYSGTVEQQEKSVSAHVIAKAFISPATNIFGLDMKEYAVNFFGELGNSVIRGRIVPDFAPNRSLNVTLLKRM